MSETPFDLVIRDGTVIDPASGVRREADVAVLGGRIVAVGDDIRDVPARRAIDATGCLVVPGLIDLHAHVYAGVTPLSVDPDPLAERSGTSTHVDAGSAGAATFDGFRRFIVEQSRSRVLAFLNISVIGLVAMPECGYGRFVDANECLRVVEANRDIVVGIKIRASRNAIGEDNTAEPVRHAVAVARAAGLPVMMHVGDPPPTFEDGLAQLRRGDIVTHAWKGQPITRLVERDGSVKPEVRAARERGVLFDIGHGSGSFNWGVAKQLAAQHFWPDTISTDVHTASIRPPVSIDMPSAMTRLWHLGMPLDEVIAAATARPAAAIGWGDRIGSLAPGHLADIAILELSHNEVTITDSYGMSEQVSQNLVARTTIVGGHVLERGSP
jgi:dihydroorotase